MATEWNVAIIPDKYDVMEVFNSVNNAHNKNYIIFL
jgi:hypothetical protein